MIYTIIIGIIAGWLAGQLSKGKGFGILGNLVVGVVGAVLGGFVFGLLGFFVGSLIGQIISATVGAVIFLWILKKLNL